MTTKTNTKIDPTEAIAITRAAIRAWFVAARTAAVGGHALDTVENIASQAMSAASKLSAALMAFSIVSKETIESGTQATVADALDSVVETVRAAHKARQAAVTSTQSYANAALYLDAQKAFASLRSKLGQLNIHSGMDRL